MEALQGFALLLLTVQVPAFAKELICRTPGVPGGADQRRDLSQLRSSGVYQTVPDTGTASNAQGSISSTPAVDGPYLYFNDMSGYLTKLNASPGSWSGERIM